MKKSRLYDQIHREFTRDSIDPAPESFYESVWHRIRTQEKQVSSIRNKEKPLASFGTVCWKSVPVFSLFLLVVSLYFWYFPADSLGSNPICCQN